MFTSKQLKQIEDMGLEEAQVVNQIKNFKEGFAYANLAKPATIGDGIIQASDSDLEQWSKSYDEFSQASRIVKFVPSSGAASRMFKTLFEFLESDITKPEVEEFLVYLEKFAFCEKLKETLGGKKTDLSKVEKKEIIKAILETPGLNYGNHPKGLLLFHKYEDGARTPVEEHFVEGILYAQTKGLVRLHFTISEEHEEAFKSEFSHLTEKYEKLQKAKIEVSYSFQKKSTDTIAVDLKNEPIIDDDGLLVFRPGGHGALLENLNDIEADLIFVKNIDNVVPDYLKTVSVRYKKALAGLLVHVRKQITDILVYLEWHDSYSEKKKAEIASFMLKYLGIKVPEGLDNTVYAGYIKAKIDKPVRVCGMVKNEGEPGGGPFWVFNRKGELSLQIIESTQVDPKDTKQQEILHTATHFNPVDLVCSIQDYTGHKFNLLKYRDHYSGFISEKTVNGKKIKAQELPGLWNGGMSHWITLFVEVPLETFNPVKTVSDLLRKEHQPK
jgi:hypothetical protein